MKSTNGRKDGCFGAVFIGILKALVYSGFYQAHAVPIIQRYIKMMRQNRIHLVLMQDSALGHAAGDTQEDLRERGITVIFWPQFSPELSSR